MESSGSIALHYVTDGDYSEQRVRKLRIDSGNVQVVQTRDSERTIYSLASMQGSANVKHDSAMVLMAEGQGDIQYNRLSTNHFLFKAEVNRDLKSSWRYEAMLE